MEISALYFSPTGNTKKAALAIARTLETELQGNMVEIDYTGLEIRKRVYEFGPDDILVLAMPTYAGRIPNKILPDLQQGIHGNDTPVITVTTFGNRSEDESLRELTMLGKENGFLPVGAATCVSEHAFSNQLATGRPDADDEKQLKEFAKKCCDKIRGKDYGIKMLDLDRPVGPYYVPKKEDGTPAKFLKAKPLTDEALCDHCGACSKVCPLDSIDPDDFSNITGTCIKCQACVRICPVHAKYFADEEFLSHVRMLEKNFRDRKESTFYL